MRVKWKGVIFTIVLFILSYQNLLAQSGDPGEPGCGTETDPDGDCNLPLDTWVYLLVIAAVVFGAYKLYQKQKAPAV